MKLYISLCVIILFSEGCKSPDSSNPVQPDFIAPHIVTAEVYKDSVEIFYSIPQTYLVTMWVTKGIGPGEVEEYLENYGAGEFFVSKMPPTKILVNDYLLHGTHRVVWDTKDENGQWAEPGYYRLFIRTGPLYQYKDIHLQK